MARRSSARRGRRRGARLRCRGFRARRSRSAPSRGRAGTPRPAPGSGRPRSGSAGAPAGRDAVPARSSGRPCRAMVSASASDQPMRAAARLNAPRCGRMIISSRANRRARVAPIPNHIGSPVASTTTRRPRRASIASTVSLSGLAQDSRSAPPPANMARCRWPPTTVSASAISSRATAPTPSRPSAPTPITESQGFMASARSWRAAAQFRGDAIDDKSTRRHGASDVLARPRVAGRSVFHAACRPRARHRVRRHAASVPFCPAPGRGRRRPDRSARAPPEPRIARRRRPARARPGRGRLCHGDRDDRGVGNPRVHAALAMGLGGRDISDRGPGRAALALRSRLRRLPRAGDGRPRRRDARPSATSSGATRTASTITAWRAPASNRCSRISPMASWRPRSGTCCSACRGSSPARRSTRSIR